jgi:hypothetical protein
MRIANQLILSILLNACWQVALLTAFAALCSWLLRATAARYQHILWVATLLLSLSMPVVSASQFISLVAAPWIQQTPTQQVVIESITPIQATQPAAPALENVPNAPIRIGQRLAASLVFVYLVIFRLQLFEISAGVAADQSNNPNLPSNRSE